MRTRINSTRFSKPLVLIGFVALTACGASNGAATHLAATGHIDDDAPIRATRSILISAPPARIWSVLTRIDDWSRWQSDIGAAHLKGSLAPGVSFDWTNNGMSISSRIERVNPNVDIAWTGQAMGLTAIHVWTLEPISRGVTRVRTDESMRGLPGSLFYSSEKLGQANTAWLSRLKTEVERNVRSRPSA